MDPATFALFIMIGATTGALVGLLSKQQSHMLPPVGGGTLGAIALAGISTGTLLAENLGVLVGVAVFWGAIGAFIAVMPRVIRFLTKPHLSN